MLAFDMGPKFSPGRIVITANAQAQVPREDVLAALKRHLRGDWGELPAQDAHENERSLLQGCRLLFAYRTSKGLQFWILTESDRSVTTILLPKDY